MTYTNAGLRQQLSMGLSDEKRVKTFLSDHLGYTVAKSTIEEDRMLDIDCWADGKPISIKAQHSGARYGNIYFELAQHLTAHSDCKLSKSLLATQPVDNATPDLLVATGSWEPSWYANGKALEYWILQGTKLYVYSKDSIVKYVNREGWLRVRTLSYQRRAYLGGDYRYCNSICGFLNIDAIAHRTFDIANLAGLSLN